MKRRQFLRNCATVGLGAALAPHAPGAPSGADANSARRPNLIFILADDVSAKEFTCYGGSGIATPTIDRMAREGVRFQTAWTAPVCGPSRALFRTGRYAFRTQYYGNGVTPTTPTYVNHLEIAPHLNRAGYRTLMVGKNHDSHPPADRGYDDWCIVQRWDGYDGPHQSPEWAGPESYKRGMYSIQWYFHPALTTPAGGIPTTPEDFGPDIEVDHIRRFIAEQGEDPFFIYWPTNLPHMMHSAERKWHYTDVPERDATGKRTGGRTPGSLKTNLEYLDYLIARIVDGLREAGKLDDTIVVFVGDNGTAGYGKHRLESEIGPRVPWIVWGPGRVTPFPMCPELTDATDLLPTLADLARAPLPEGYVVDGHSYADMLLGRAYTPREWIFTQMDEARWLRDKRWLLDGNGRFWDCADLRDETVGYRDVTESTDDEVIAARRRFEAILDGFPPIDYDHPDTRAKWAQHRAGHAPHRPYRPPYLDEATAG